ncbi:hypothetical protein DY000_02037359 [Brassica cretica]|uniref:Uncharacterized protein n=1 Tax=Brassica cretica TaxID=69181 RepID=A0ABQ7BKL1_BRACR|nr:hypothetical protein DY000_02037359 [Brassica cretica]
MSISFAVLATKGGDTLRDAFPSHRIVTVYRLAFGNRFNRVGEFCPGVMSTLSNFSEHVQKICPVDSKSKDSRWWFDLELPVPGVFRWFARLNAPTASFRPVTVGDVFASEPHVFFVLLGAARGYVLSVKRHCHF